MDGPLYEAFTAYAKNGKYLEAYDCLTGLYPDDRRGTYPVICAFRQLLKNVLQNGYQTAEVYEILHQTYILTGRDRLDDFWIAMEWYRRPGERFWLPRREKLLPICEAWQAMEDGELDELFLSQPPRTGKTGFNTGALVWVMCRHPELSNLYCSYTDSVVVSFYEGVMEMLNDPDTYDIRSMFPEFRIASTNAADHTLNLGRRKKYASLSARSLYGALNGMVDASGYILADDLHSGSEEALNPMLLDKAYTRVTNNLLARRKENTKIIWVGTRWSVHDTIARRIDALENDPRLKGIRYKVINVPALDDNDESNFEYAYGLGFSTQKYLEVRATFERADDMASWWAQFMGKPVERLGAVFAPESLRYYNGTLPDGIEPDRIWMAVDPAWGGGDYATAGVFYQYGDDLYLHDVVYDNSDKSVTQPMIANRILTHGVSQVYVEGTKATGTYAEGVDRIVKQRGGSCSIQNTTKHWGGTGGQQGKAQRIYDRAPDIRQMVVFRDTQHRTREYEKFMQNLFMFTAEGKVEHDDAPDMLAIALETLGNGRKTLRVLSRSVLDVY